MPSEDSKGVKRGEEEEECLGSMLLAQKKRNIQNGKAKNAAAASSIPKPQARASTTSNKVKKEEPRSENDDDDDDDFDVPIKGRAGSGSAKATKKENVEDEDSKPISRRASASSSKAEKGKELSKKKKEKVKESSSPLQNGKKRERKVYDLPGQKRDPPEERDPLRMFYESLYKQLPGSEMAQFWMMESGLLAKEVAQKIFEKKQKKNPRLSTPMKAGPASKNSQSTTTKKKMATSPRSFAKPKTAGSGVASKQPTKRKLNDESNEDDSDEEFVARKATKKQRAS